MKTAGLSVRCGMCRAGPGERCKRVRWSEAVEESDRVITDETRTRSHPSRVKNEAKLARWHDSSRDTVKP